MSLTRRERFTQARSYVLYYGHGAYEQLMEYDIAIVEPRAHTRESIQALQAKNTLVLAYITFMELGPIHEMYAMLREEDFLHSEGRRVYKEAFDTYMVSPFSKRWKGLLHHHIGRLLVLEGYDGIFIDTIGDIEDPIFPPIEQRRMAEEAVEILRRMRQTFPNHVFVQNNGLEMLCTLTGPYLDGMCWENPPFTQPESSEWCADVLKRLAQLKSAYGVRSLFLHDDSVIQHRPSAAITAQAIADQYDYLYYTSADHYLSIK